MQRRRLLAATILTLGTSALAADVRVLVWDEQQPRQKEAYDNFLGNEIAGWLGKQPGIAVKSVKLDDPENGLDAASLDATDVVVWWGHVRHADVNPERVRDLTERVKAGKIGLIALHSAHWSQPFMRLMEDRARADALQQVPAAERLDVKWQIVRPKPFAVPKRTDPITPSVTKLPGGEWQLTLPNCVFPAYRADGAPSHVKTLLPAHPIAREIPQTWDIPQTEMYDEPFHVPKPDAVVFEEHWDKGEHFRSGCVWQVDKGRVFYFRPGHEQYPVFKQPLVLKVIENAIRWLGAPAK